MKIYIASSWKNQHAVEMLTALLRAEGHEILSFVENNHGENPNSSTNEKFGKPMPFAEWCASADGERSFIYDTDGATKSDLVIYIGPSGTDAWAEVGAAYGSGVRIFGLWAKGEQGGLMRRMMSGWFDFYSDLLEEIQALGNTGHLRCPRCSSVLGTGLTAVPTVIEGEEGTRSNGTAVFENTIKCHNCGYSRGEKVEAAAL